MLKACNWRLYYHKSHLLCLSGHFNYGFACRSCIVFVVLVDSVELKLKTEEMLPAASRLNAVETLVASAGGGCGCMVSCGKQSALRQYINYNGDVLLWRSLKRGQDHLHIHAYICMCMCVCA